MSFHAIIQITDYPAKGYLNNYNPTSTETEPALIRQTGSLVGLSHVHSPEAGSLNPLHNVIS